MTMKLSILKHGDAVLQSIRWLVWNTREIRGCRQPGLNIMLTGTFEILVGTDQVANYGHASSCREEHMPRVQLAVSKFTQI